MSGATAASLGPQSDDPNQLALTRSSSASFGSISADGHPYLIVVEHSSSAPVALPRNGVLIIGRDPDADLRVRDGAASRKHARLQVSNGAVRVTDLGSRNGTCVNGERVEGSRALQPGDVITIGDVTMVLQGARSAPTGRRLLDGDAFYRRLQEEVDRAVLTGDPFGLLVIVLESEDAADETLEDVLDRELRRVDVAGRLGAELVAILPSHDGDKAEPAARNVIKRLAAEGIGARAGVATYPAAACASSALVVLARAAAAEAGPGGVARHEAASRVQIGERSIIVADPAMVRIYELVRRLAAARLPVLVCGETGAGKEIVATALHRWSPRSRGPLVVVNCAALPESLIESELFGHERGAFSGSVHAKPGLIESADGGTVFLDEVGELPRHLQSKLLRVIEDGNVMRLGATRAHQIDVRFVAATNRDLPTEVREARFREDLMYRLSAATVLVPPLRDRPAEISMLAQLFLERACAEAGLATKAFSPRALHALAAHAWPGNVRELRNVAAYLAAVVPLSIVDETDVRERLRGRERVATDSDGATLPPRNPDPDTTAPPPIARPVSLAEELRALECHRMTEALARTGGVQSRAAALLGMPLRTFHHKTKQYGLGRRTSSSA